jgi:hypothetical protein
MFFINKKDKREIRVDKFIEDECNKRTNIQSMLPGYQQVIFFDSIYK